MLAGWGKPATSSTLMAVFFLLPHFREDLDQEEKARFGELCSSENGKGREWFARYVSAQVRGEMGEGAAILYQGRRIRPRELSNTPKQYFWRAGIQGKGGTSVQGDAEVNKCISRQLNTCLLQCGREVICFI